MKHPVERSDATQSLTERNNDTESCKGGTSLAGTGKQTVYTVQSIENRNL